MPGTRTAGRRACGGGGARRGGDGRLQGAAGWGREAGAESPQAPPLLAAGAGRSGSSSSESSACEKTLPARPGARSAVRCRALRLARGAAHLQALVGQVQARDLGQRRSRDVDVDHAAGEGGQAAVRGGQEAQRCLSIGAGEGREGRLGAGWRRYGVTGRIVLGGAWGA
jgi:hypothetical protein